MTKKRRILIWKEYRPGNHLDVQRRLDYSLLYDEVNEYCNGNPTNVGNKVWMQGLISEISSPENEICFLDENEEWESINSGYDLIVFSTANLFAIEHKDYIRELADTFSHSSIPVFVIAVGAQAKSYDDIEILCNEIGNEVRLFVDSIYSSGGELALRGWFTKEFLEKTCSNTAVVTGCPSMYQNGRDVRVTKKQISREEFAPIINGDTDQALTLLYKYKKSVYIDQDIWFFESYATDFWRESDDRKLFGKLVDRHGLLATKLFLDNRIKLFYDVPEWRSFIISSDFSCSYGTRIHGNIMTLLCGVPALIRAMDSRTREMAEFFGIPYCINGSTNDLWGLFEDLDYSFFNSSFKRKYDDFEKFLKKHNIVSEIGTSEMFWNRELPHSNAYIEERKKDLLDYSKRYRVNEYQALAKRKCYRLLSNSGFFSRNTRTNKKKVRVYNNAPMIEFYLVDAFEIYHFLELYRIFEERGILSAFVAESPEINTSGRWFDQEESIRILERLGVRYYTHCNPECEYAMSTQDAWCLSKYRNKKIHLQYGPSLPVYDYCESSRAIDGFDIKLVTGKLSYDIVRAKNKDIKMFIIGYPKFYSDNDQDYEDGNESLSRIIIEKNIENKQVLFYFPTWDEESSILRFADTIEGLRDRFFIVTKAHHCTFRLDREAERMNTLKEISDIILPGNYSFSKAARESELVMCDAKSGASVEVPYLNPNVRLVLLYSGIEEKDRYIDAFCEIWRF